MNLAHDVELNVSCTSPGVTSKERPRRLASERNPRTARQRWSLPQLGHTSSCMLDTTNQPNSICRMVSLQVTTVADHTRTLNEGPHAALGTVALACCFSPHRNGNGTTAKLERVVRVQRGTPPWPNAIDPVQLLPLRNTLLDARGNALAHLRAYQGRRTTLASAHHSNPIVTLPAKH